MIHATEHKSAAPLTPAGLQRPGIYRMGKGGFAGLGMELAAAPALAIYMINKVAKVTVSPLCCGGLAQEITASAWTSVLGEELPAQ